MNIKAPVDNFGVVLIVGACAIVAAWMVYRAWQRAGKSGCGGGACSCAAKIPQKIVKKS